MLIEEWMTQSVHSVKPLDSILHAREVMSRRRVNQLPVVRDGELVGIITDRDLRDAFPSVFETVEREFAAERLGGRGKQRPISSGSDPSQITVDLVMSPQPLSLSPGDSVDEAASLMRRKRIGAIPIVEGKKIVGILTRSDVLGAFVALAGSSKTIGA